MSSQRKFKMFQPSAADQRAALRVADMAMSPVDSPVHALQARLAAGEFPEPDVGHYPILVRVGLIVGGSAFLWAAIGVMLIQVI
ncbi:hypothetical protein [Sphingomonas immobilis]|uniref:Uncharacterized protein n=1 Tax=Sphingomonas immobilis TaxID=3063997 RepID=A0ABT9A786_9SPHN|nr:hypothetical protein [Sphingomonas sp. CA1-15]MDO7844627.1 hypothetical protein [Sphingomonas sp. CA1-15]